LLDDARIFSRALSQTEISSAMLTPVSPIGTGTSTKANTVSMSIGKSDAPTRSPFVQVKLDRAAYGSAKDVRATTLRVTNPTEESRPVEFKTWIQTPEGLLSLSSIGNDGLLVLGPGEDDNLGPALVLEELSDLAGGSYRFGCSLVDPATGALISSSEDRFAISSTDRPKRPQRRAPAQLVIDESSRLTLSLDDRTISVPDLAVRNTGDQPESIEVKVWLESSENLGALPVAALGAAGDFTLAGGSSMQLDLAAALREVTLAPGSYALFVRLVQPPTGAEIARYSSTLTVK